MQCSLKKIFWDSPQRCLDLLNAVTDYIYSVDIQDGKVIATTHGAGCFLITGYTQEEFDTNLHLWYDIVVEDDRERVIDHAKAIFERKAGYPLEHRIVHKDGSIRWVRNITVAHVDEHHQLVGYDGLISDITPRKQAEERIQKSHDELEQQVQERTAQLIAANEELRHAWQAAEVAAQTKARFLANTSHEIVNPINAIIGMTTILLESSLTGNQRESVEIIRLSGEILLTIIHDILDFSKIEAGKLTLERQSFDIHRCIEEAIDLVSEKASEKNLNLAYLMDENVPHLVIGDITRIRQILLNLLSNAVKFTQEGEVIVSITVENQTLQIERGGSSCILHIQVRDTGTGIANDQLPLLFQSFQQANVSTTRQYGGTGLGLVISKRLAEMMGGTIWAESEEGQGSVFHVTIQVGTTYAGLAKQEPLPAHLVQGQPLLAGRRVLIVESHATNRFVLLRQVQFWEMACWVTDSYEQAQEWLVQGEQFDVVILGIHLPLEHSASLITYIQFELKTQNVPLILLSSLRLQSHITHNIKLNHVTYLTNPVKPAQLYHTLITLFYGVPELERTSFCLYSPDPHLGQRHPLRILLAEDNMINQRVTLYLLESLGYRADSVTNGKEVLHSLERQQYDVILMDMQMPEMDGLEAIHHIRSVWPKQQQPWMIAMTVSTNGRDRSWYLAQGIDDFLDKPISRENLVQALTQVKKHHPEEYHSRGVHSKEGALSNRECPPIDIALLKKYTSFEGIEFPALVQVILQSYLDEVPSKIQAMHEAVDTQDFAVLSRLAHGLKSSSKQIGAVMMSTLFAQLESVGQAGINNGVKDVLVKTEMEFDRVQQFLGNLSSDQSQPSTAVFAVER